MNPNMVGSTNPKTESLDLSLEHPRHTVQDWRNDVYNGNTLLGYISWVEHALEVEDDENKGWKMLT